MPGTVIRPDLSIKIEGIVYDSVSGTQICEKL
mgnify:CR=1 FL=1